MGSPSRQLKQNSSEMETENFTVWLSLANTVFASIAFMIWYMGIGQEDDKLDESKVVIIDEEDLNDGDMEEDKHLYVLPDLRNEKNLFDYQDYCYYQQINNEEDERNVLGKSKKTVRFAKTVSQKVFDVNEGINEKISKQESVGDSNHELEVKHTQIKKTKQLEPTQHNTESTILTFKWPQNEELFSEIVRIQPKKNIDLGDEIKEKIRKLGISRVDTESAKSESVEMMINNNGGWKKQKSKKKNKNMNKTKTVSCGQ